MWPPASPNLNPVDFSVWSLLKAKVSSVAHSSAVAFKTSLLRECTKIPQKTLRASVDNYRQIIKLLIVKKGHHSENKLFEFILGFPSYNF